ncbi:hypothetical protein PIB30_025965 [Stylosanthes scabra]|uniref:Uncharacterized protein n=1 Tax=Stylosanthes scabra TaxID=79078 RepID=A0ABU6S9M8_9FABA|nr:hypothetical protein [Stylosanthes scabra]
MSQPRFTLMNPLLLLLLVLFSHNALSFSSSSSSSMDLNLLNNVVSRRVCKRSIGECLAENEMMMMDSESNRRILAMQQKRYISYDTLKRDMVPCDRPGASYYNCHARQAHPYNRGCEVITGCARGSVQGTNN